MTTIIPAVQLIPTWRHAWKFTSVIITAVLAICDLMYASLDVFRYTLTPVQFAIMNTLLGVAAILARLVQQTIGITAAEKGGLIAVAHEMPEAPTPIEQTPSRDQSEQDPL